MPKAVAKFATFSSSLLLHLDKMAAVTAEALKSSAVFLSTISK